MESLSNHTARVTKDISPVEVNIGGQQYSIRSDLSEIQVEQLAKYVDEVFRRIRERSPTIVPSQVSILAALNIAEELFRVRDHCAEVTRRVTELIQLIDQKCSPSEKSSVSMDDHPVIG